MSGNSLDNILQKAKAELRRRMTTSSRHTAQGRSPADPTQRHQQSIKRLADKSAVKMCISWELSVLSPDIAQLNDHLRELSITHTNISDISALRALPNLEKLEILASPICDLSPLAALKNLKELKFNFCSDAPIKVPHLPELRRLEILNTHGDIVLGDLPKLEIAKFQTFTDLSQVTRQPLLKNLHFEKVENQTLEALLVAKNLKNLDARLQGPADLRYISALSKLEKLRLIAPEVSDISPLGMLVGLTELDINDVQTCDAKALSSLINLISLQLRFQAPLDDLSFLSSMSKLSLLSFRPSKNANLRAITDLPRLNELRMALIDPNVDLAPLSSCQALRTLFISTDKNMLADKSQPLPAPPQLLELILMWTGLSGIEGLQECRKLERIHCSYTKIESLSPLAGMKNLVGLNVAGSNVSDLSVLTTLPRFVAEDAHLSLAIKGTPAVKRYPELADTVAMETGRNGRLYQHKTALKAVRLLRQMVENP